LRHCLKLGLTSSLLPDTYLQGSSDTSSGTTISIRLLEWQGGGALRSAVGRYHIRTYISSLTSICQDAKTVSTTKAPGRRVWLGAA
jgi:hypothetical protein